MREPIRILLVEDQYFARLALRSVIDAREEMRIVAESANGAEALALYRAHRPDLVMMDLRLPGLSGEWPNGLSGPSLRQRRAAARK